MNQSELEIKTCHRCRGRENMKRVLDAETSAQRGKHETETQLESKESNAMQALENVPKLSVDWILFCQYIHEKNVTSFLKLNLTRQRQNWKITILLLLTIENVCPTI